MIILIKSRIQIRFIDRRRRKIIRRNIHIPRHRPAAPRRPRNRPNDQLPLSITARGSENQDHPHSWLTPSASPPRPAHALRPPYNPTGRWVSNAAARIDNFPPPARRLHITNSSKNSSPPLNINPPPTHFSAFLQPVYTLHTLIFTRKSAITAIISPRFSNQS